MNKEVIRTALITEIIGKTYDPMTINASPEVLAREIRNLKNAVYTLAGALDVLWARYEALKGD